MAGLSATLFGFEISPEFNEVTAYLGRWRGIAEFFRFPIKKAHVVNSRLGCRLSPLNGTTSDNVRVTAEPANNLASKSPEDIGFAIAEDIQQFLEHEISSAALKTNQSRAIVVLHKGKIVAEVYQGLLGIGVDTPLLGWSMTKSVQAAIVAAGHQNKIFDVSKLIQNYPGLSKNITIMELLQMKDLLLMSEDYSLSGAVPRMLFNSADFADEALRDDGSHRTSTTVTNGDQWYYSSGLSNVLAKYIRSHFKSDTEYHNFPFKFIFEEIGASSFVLETDPSGTFVASSFSYATARDWAKLAQLFLQEGQWDGRQILSKEVIQLIRQPTKGSAGHYGGRLAV